jgi:hypothetical protein
LEEGRWACGGTLRAPPERGALEDAAGCPAYLSPGETGTETGEMR